MAKKVIESVQDPKDTNLYEFAFHLVPKMSAEDAVSAFTDIKKQITATGAIIKNESAPATLNLAYTMEHTVESVRSKYNQAYFAWVIFEAVGDQVTALNEEIKLRNDIIRYLLITTKNESPIQASDVANMITPKEKRFAGEEVEEVAAEEVVEEASLDIEDVDSKVDDAIDKIVE